MTKTKLIFVGLAVALVGFLFAGSASAQGQTMTASPSSVSAPGTYDIDVSASGFTIDQANIAVCSTGDSSQLADQAGLFANCGGIGTTVDLDNGSYSTTLDDVEITEAGVTVLLFELAVGGESASASINIGDDMMDDDMMDDDMLPATGVNTSVLVIIGVGIALAGVMVFGLSRRLRSL